jgi:hypothetical protein
MSPQQEPCGRRNMGSASSLTKKCNRCWKQNDFLLGPSHRYKVDIPVTALESIAKNFERVSKDFSNAYIAPDEKYLD